MGIGGLSANLFLTSRASTFYDEAGDIGLICFSPAFTTRGEEVGARKLAG